MTVVTLSSCLPSLRADLTLWLQEINTGTFVGHVNARVRDLLWEHMMKDGLDEREAMQKLKEFIGNLPVVAHNVKFDIDFIRAACERSGIEWNDPVNFDTVKMAREKIPGMQSYKLENLLEHFQLSHEHLHRALNDSRAVHALYCKLNEK